MTDQKKRPEDAEYDREKAEIAKQGPVIPSVKTLGDALHDWSLSEKESVALNEPLGGASGEFHDLERPYVHRLKDAKSDQEKEAIRAKIITARLGWNTGMPLCETPIEKRMLPHLIFEQYGRDLPRVTPVCDPKSVDAQPPAAPLFIVPQMQFLRYRLDFALVRRLARGVGIVALECDGAEFHDAERDRVRDSWLSSFQIKTIRATGSQIHDKPSLVSARVAEAVMMLEG